MKNFARTVVGEDNMEKKATTRGHIHSQATVRLPGESDEDLENSINEAFFRMFHHFDTFKNLQGTGWHLEEILFMKFMMVRYKPLRGGSFLELPSSIKHSKSILNIKNKDDKCLLWSILAALHPVPHDEHAYRVSKYEPFEHKLNMALIEYPVSYKDIPKFVKQNDLSVQVVGYEDSFFPLLETRPQKDAHVNLLHFERNGQGHYCLIQDFNKMLSSQSNHHGRSFHCTYGFHGFVSENLLNKHIPYCKNHGHQWMALPSSKEEAKMELTQFTKMLKMPFVIYVNFECILELIKKEGKKSANKSCGYSYLVVSADEEIQPETVTYSDENVLDNFFEDISRETEDLMKIVKTNKPMIFTEEDEEVYDNIQVCHICERLILNNEDHIPKKERLGPKVRDHYHLT